MTSTGVNNETKNQNLTVLIRRTLKVPVAVAYRAWTEPSQMQKWFGCDAVVNPDIEQDFRVGGHYSITGKSCSGESGMSIHGTFKEIVENKKLVYTWTNESAEVPADNTIVSIEFIDHGGTTEIVLEHTKFAVESSAQGHSVGWSQSFDKLEALLIKLN